MAKTYQDLGNGQWGIDSPVGVLPVAMSQDELAGAGYVPAAIPAAGPKLAQNMSVPEPAMSFAPPAPPPMRADVPPAMAGAGGAGPGPALSPAPPGPSPVGGMAAGGASSGPAPINTAPVTPTLVKVPVAPAPTEQPRRVVRIMGTRGSPGTREDKWQATQRQSQTTTYDPEAMQEYEAGAVATAQDRAASYMTESQLHARQAQELYAEAAATSDAGKMQRAKINQALSDFETERAKIASMQVDPNKYFSDRGALSLLQIAANAAGEYGHVLGRTAQNNAVQIMNAGIEREIQAQLQAIDARRNGLQTQMTLMDRYLQANDPAVAEQLTRATLKEAALHEFEGAKAQGLVSQVQSETRAEIAKVKADASKVTVSGGEAFIPKGTGATAGTPEQRIDMTNWSDKDREYWANASTAKEQAARRDEIEARNWKGGGETKPYATEAAKNLSLAQQLEKNAARLQEAYASKGRSAVLNAMTPGTELYDIRANSADILGRLRSGAAISASEAERFQNLLGGKRHVVGGGDLAAKSVQQVRNEARGMVQKLSKEAQQESPVEKPKSQVY